jgi:hypothetical protein
MKLAPHPSAAEERDVMNGSEVLEIVTALGITLLACGVGRNILNFWERDKLRPEPARIRSLSKPRPG